MGLQDRDYMHERREAPFSPAPQSATPAWLILLLVVSVGYATYRGYERWLGAAPRSNPSVASTSSSDAGHPPAAVSPSAPLDPSAVPRPAWSRCELDGKTMYTDGPCPAGASRVVEEASAPQMEGSNQTLTLYHCKGYDGRTFWANSHCNQHRALVDRMVNVPARAPFDQQVAMAEGQRRAVQQAVQQRVPAASPAPNAVVDSSRAVCDQLDARVRSLDAMARQPQPAAMQDWIRGERQTARDRQFRLRC
jgi:hypothetical protein